MKNPDEEIPINNKNIFNFPFTFSLNVKNISIAPNKKKMANGSKKRSEPLNKSLIAGTKS